uniref:Uncharacterized protein n=1 Tax=Plectus sambesii TaxID=2011161 RepID=A0A914W0X7_9BILA
MSSEDASAGKVDDEGGGEQEKGRGVFRGWKTAELRTWPPLKVALRTAEDGESVSKVNAMKQSTFFKQIRFLQAYVRARLSSRRFTAVAHPNLTRCQ